MKKKKAKKIIAIVLVCAIVLGGAGAGVFTYLRSRGGEVNVFPVSQLMAYQSIYNQNQTDGTVSTDRMQSVYLTSTQTVTEVYVTEGQEVKIGDPILSFDTTLSEVDLERARIQVEQLKLDIEDAQNMLKEIGTYKVGSPADVTFLGSNIQAADSPTLTPEELPLFQGGNGTQSDPYVFLWSDELTFFDDMIDYLISLANGEGGELPSAPDATPVPETTPSPMPTLSPTPSPTPTPAPTPEDTAAPTPEDTSTPMPEETVAPTPEDTPTSTPEETTAPTPEDTPTPVTTPSDTPTTTPGETAEGAALEPVSLRAPVRKLSQVLRDPDEPEQTDGPEDPVETEEPGDGNVYMVFEVRTADSLRGDILRSFEMAFRPYWIGTDADGDPVYTWLFRVIDPVYTPSNLPVTQDTNIDADDFYFDTSVYYSASEIAQMKSDTQQQLTQLKIDLRLAEQDLKQKEFEMSNGEVLAEVDGVVKTLRDPDEALTSGDPVVMVSGGGGYIVEAVMGEFDIGVLHVGDTVTIFDWRSGSMYDGVITEISEYPGTGGDYWYYSQTGNNNTSLYPFKVSVGEDANLRENYGVTVYLPSASDGTEADTSGVFLNSMFIRSEGGRSYIYVASGNDTLEKRYISTGQNLYGSYLEITGGLTEEDYIAFPYGRSVKDGAKVVRQEDLTVLYNGY